MIANPSAGGTQGGALPEWKTYTLQLTQAGKLFEGTYTIVPPAGWIVCAVAGARGMAISPENTSCTNGDGDIRNELNYSDGVISFYSANAAFIPEVTFQYLVI